MNKKNLVGVIILSLLLISLIILVVLNFIPSTSDNQPDHPVDNPNAQDVVLKESTDAGNAYLDKLYFVGDSTTYHFFKGGIDKSHILVPESLTLMLDSDISNVTVGNKGLTIAQALKSANAEIVIITVGVNGADHFTEKAYKTYYTKLINAIKNTSPNTQIILQSVFPVTEEYSQKNIGITNTGIDRLNSWVKDIAKNNGLYYLDTQSILKNKNGAQKLEYNEGDGVHMNSDAYKAILYYIRTHAIDKE